MSQKCRRNWAPAPFIEKKIWITCFRPLETQSPPRVGMSCFWCPNWLHISSFRDKAVSHLASGIFVFNAVAPCKDFPLLPQDVPALLVRRSPHWRAAHTQSRLRPQWEVLRKQEVGDNVWDQRLRWVGEIYFDSTWFSPCSCFICIMVGTITSKEIAKPQFYLTPCRG